MKKLCWCTLHHVKCPAGSHRDLFFCLFLYDLRLLRKTVSKQKKKKETLVSFWLSDYGNGYANMSRTQVLQDISNNFLRVDGISKHSQRLHWEALISGLLFVCVRMCYKSVAVACTPFICSCCQGREDTRVQWYEVSVHFKVYSVNQGQFDFGWTHTVMHTLSKYVHLFIMF